MKNLSFLNELYGVGSVEYKICGMDLSSAAFVEVCLREEGYSLGVYFTRYNKQSQKLYTNILDIGNISNRLKNIVRSQWFNSQLRFTMCGLNINANTLKLYKGSIKPNSVAIGSDYDITTNELKRTKNYSAIKGGLKVTWENNGKIVESISTEVQTPNKLSDICKKADKLNISYKLYERDNGQGYIY